MLLTHEFEHSFNFYFEGRLRYDNCWLLLVELRRGRHDESGGFKNKTRKIVFLLPTEKLVRLSHRMLMIKWNVNKVDNMLKVAVKSTNIYVECEKKRIHKSGEVEQKRK